MPFDPETGSPSRHPEFNKATYWLCDLDVHSSHYKNWFHEWIPQSYAFPCRICPRSTVLYICRIDTACGLIKLLGKIIRWLCRRIQLPYRHDTGDSATQGGIEARSPRSSWTRIVATRRLGLWTSLCQWWGSFRAPGRTKVRQCQGFDQGRILEGMWTPINDVRY